MFGIGPMEMLVLGAIAVLLFGQRLPEVMKNLGKSVGEFQRGIRGFTDDIHTSNSGNSRSPSPYTPPVAYNPIDDRDEATAPKFEPPKFEPPKAEAPASSATPTSPTT